MVEIESLDRVGGRVVKKNSVHVRLAKRKTVYISIEKQYTTFIITGTSQNLNPKIKSLSIAYRLAKIDLIVSRYYVVRGC